MDLSRCTCHEAGFCPVFGKVMGHSPPNWKWCQGTTEQKRKDYYLKSNPVSVASKIVERKNYSQYFFEEVKSDPEPNPKSKNLIITVGAGPIGSLYKFSGPLMQDYSQKVGADFILLEGQTQKYWGNEKFRIRKYSSAYERILFLDIDILIKRNSPNLFDIIDEDCVSMHNDRDFLTPRWGIKDKKKLLSCRFDDEKTIDRLANTKKVYNTGVVLSSKCHENLWEPISYDYRQTHWDEQFQIESNCLYYEYKTKDLPTEFNCQSWMKDFDTMKKDAFFIHYAGDKNREENMERDLELCW